MRSDVYERVTNKIIEALGKGVRPWMKPWSADHAGGRITRPLRANGIPYRGINVLMLWSEAMEKGYAAPIWMTFKQALELNAHVRKGERGSLVVFASKLTRTEADEDSDEDETREIPFMKGYTVFNAEQVEGLPAHFYARPEPPREAQPRIAHAERFVRATGAKVAHGGGQAFYSLKEDRVQMPPFEAFRDAPAYYATLIHELTHYAAFRIMPRRRVFLRTGEQHRRRMSA